MNDNNIFLLFILGLGIASLGMAKMASSKRGIRNNNPGNIKHSADKWVGMAPVQDDKMFVKFTSPEYGLRAMYRNLLTYRNTHGLNTIRGIIKRWAQKDVHGDVPYESYFSFLENKMDLSRDSVIPLNKYAQLIAGIIQFENGENPYTMTQIDTGIALA